MVNKTESQTPTENWDALASHAQDGDQRSYNALLSEIYPYVRNYLIGGLANPDWAEDITQEVLISVHKSLKTYSPDRPFKPWLMAIVSFRRTDYLRKHYNRRRDKQTSLEDPSFIKEHVTSIAHAGEYKDIEDALDDLPEKQKKIIQLMKISGYTAKEVADQMGMSESAVKVSAHRTMTKLKDKLDKAS